MEKQKLIRITTVPISLDKLLTGQLQFMSSYYKVIAVSSEKDNLHKLGEKEKVDTFHVEMSRKITPVADLIAVFRLYLFLKREKPLIVHSHTPKAGIVGMMAAKFARVPHRLHTVAGLPLLEAHGAKRKLLDFVEKVTYACATKVYPNSSGLKNIILENRYCESKKLKVIAQGSSNGINTSLFKADLFSVEQRQDLKEKLGVKEDHFVFVFVGRLVKDKGINELIEAFESLTKTQSKARLLLVGDYEHDLDPLEHTTLDVISKNEAIISVGFQYDVRPYFAIANALVFPSYREGFPNVVMQAGAMELPCIVSNINGCNEIINEGVNGTIIPVKNKDAIFDKMTLFLEDATYYRQLQANARKMILSRYDQRVVWEALLEEYLNLK
jgi:glycosyltransferase involved in cell wall biosynthesis